jgi:hypothetical protein
LKASIHLPQIFESSRNNPNKFQIARILSRSCLASLGARDKGRPLHQSVLVGQKCLGRTQTVLSGHGHFHTSATPRAVNPIAKSPERRRRDASIRKAGCNDRHQHVDVCFECYRHEYVPLSCRRTSGPYGRYLPGDGDAYCGPTSLVMGRMLRSLRRRCLPFDIHADRSCTGIKDFRAISANSSLSNVRRVLGNLCLSDFAENTQLNARERCHPSAPSKRVAKCITYDL